MTTNADDTSSVTPTTDFESALRSLVLESFARGATIQGSWEITSSSSVVPDWLVTIEKISTGAPPEGDADFLDE